MIGERPKRCQSLQRPPAELSGCCLAADPSQKPQHRIAVVRMVDFGKRRRDGAVEIGGDDSGIDIGLSAYRHAVAQQLRNVLQTIANIMFRRRRGHRSRRAGEPDSSSAGSTEGPKILGGEAFPGDAPEVGVDVARCDSAQRSVAFPVPEEALSWQFVQLPYRGRQLPVSDAARMADAALASEREGDRRTVASDMAVLQRRHAEALVFSGIFIITDPDQRQFQQPQHGRQNAVMRYARQAQIMVDTGTDRR